MHDPSPGAVAFRFANVLGFETIAFIISRELGEVS